MEMSHFQERCRRLWHRLQKPAVTPVDRGVPADPGRRGKREAAARGELESWENEGGAAAQPPQARPTTSGPGD